MKTSPKNQFYCSHRKLQILLLAKMHFFYQPSLSRWVPWLCQLSDLYSPELPWQFVILYYFILSAIYYSFFYRSLITESSLNVFTQFSLCPVPSSLYNILKLEIVFCSIIYANTLIYSFTRPLSGPGSYRSMTGAKS